ncbi:hypothetical protein SAMN06295974_3753 [Plantibacter flavus]|uniref:Uncharacterized protein n=1 Tax=Plantibacter flavus TaxID=150123 RepID=A0A3N2BLG8_9MICO|nr:hypothetical protein [Plantibacter flavus]ROR76099.1 hypothetical protein EDD42_4052 [Plantibacter flavus]SMG48552.1 hypothetical protein SAMN06295974_3753 [Plantibacter flavus]
MFNLSPMYSWILLILLAVAVIGLVVLLARFEQVKSQREARARAAAAVAAAPLATVTELRPARGTRHLTLVPDLPESKREELYDWRVSGL